MATVVVCLSVCLVCLACIACLVLPCHVLACLVLSCRFCPSGCSCLVLDLPCLVTFACLVLFVVFAVPCLVLPCLVLTCLICLVPFFFGTLLSEEHPHTRSKDIVLHNGSRPLGWDHCMPTRTPDQAHVPDPILIVVSPGQPRRHPPAFLPKVPPVVVLRNEIPQQPARCHG